MNTSRPMSGKTLLQAFKDNSNPISKLCFLLRVDYRVDYNGYPTKTTIDSIIETLCHQIEDRDYQVKILLDRLKMEMKRNKYPITTKDEWEIFKIFDADDKWKG